MKQFYTYLLIALLCLGNFSSAYSQRKKKNKTDDQPLKEQKVDSKQLQKFQYTFGEGLRAKLTGDLNHAEQYFRECIKLDPGEPDPYFELSNISHQLGRLDAAVEYAKKAADINPDNYWYQMLYAESLQKLNRFEESLDVIRKLTISHPEKPRIFMKLAVTYFVVGEYEKGIAVLDEQEKKFGPSPELIEPKRMAYLRLNNIDKAAAETRKLIAIDPDDIENYIDLVEIYMSVKNDSELVKVYDQMRERFPNNGRLHLVMADYHRQKGENKEAFEELKLAFRDPEVGIDNKVKILLNYYSLINRFPEYKKEAFELNEVLIATHPDEAKSHTIFGDFLYNEKELEKARNEFSRALELDESPFAIWNQVIIIDAELNRFDSVVAVCNRALELFPNQPSLHYFCGIGNVQMNRYDEAVKNFEAGKKLVFDNTQLLLQFEISLGEAYNELKNYKASDAAYDAALKIDSNNANVLNNYSYYLSLRMENLEKAERMSARSNQLAENQPSYLDTYAWIMYQQKKYDEALKWIEKALQYGGDKSAEVLEHAGDISYQLNDKVRALQYWEKAKQANGEGSPFLDQKIRDQRLYE